MLIKENERNFVKFSYYSGDIINSCNYKEYKKIKAESIVAVTALKRSKKNEPVGNNERKKGDK